MATLAVRLAKEYISPLLIFVWCVVVWLEEGWRSFFAALVLLILAVIVHAKGDMNATPCGEVQDIQLVGTLHNFTKGNMPEAPDYWTVAVNEVLLGRTPCNETIRVVTYQAAPPPWGSADRDLKPGDKAWISGRYISRDCEVTLQGSDQYYLRKYPDEIKFIGTVSGFGNIAAPGGGPRWDVKVDRLISGPKPCNNLLTVTTFQAIYPSVWGRVDPNIQSGDRVEVFGAYSENDAADTCGVTLYGSTSYYIKNLSSQTNGSA
jgi:hypothetical protein